MGCRGELGAVARALIGGAVLLLSGCTSDALAPAASTAVAAPSTPPAFSVPDARSLVGVWVVADSALERLDGPITKLKLDVREEVISISVECNSMSADYVVDDGFVRTSWAGNTEMTCGEESDRVERELYEAFESDGLSIAGADELLLTVASVEVPLRRVEG